MDSDHRERLDRWMKEEHAVIRDLLDEWYLAGEMGWARALTEQEARLVLSVLAKVYDTKNSPDRKPMSRG